MSQPDRPRHESLPDGEPAIERSVDEVAALHHGEWILLQVTERDKHHQPSRGIVVATGPFRRSIQSVAMAKFKESRDRGNGEEYYIFTGYRRLTGDEWAEALDEVVRQGTLRGPRRRQVLDSNHLA